MNVSIYLSIHLSIYLSVTAPGDINLSDATDGGRVEWTERMSLPCRYLKHKVAEHNLYQFGE